MQAIIIAAGMGNRCLPHTSNTPKCLLSIHNTTLLDNLISQFEQANIEKIAIVVGYCAEKIVSKVKKDYPYIDIYTNDDYANNNILHSLMYARNIFNDDLIISYSDIWLEQQPLSHLINTQGKCVLAVDSEWQSSYIGRTDHPLSEAEKVLYDTKQCVFQLGKHLPAEHENFFVGEFIGLAKISKAFCPTFINIFDELNQKLTKQAAFQFSACWQKAYLTDFFNELIQRGHGINCSMHPNDWFEMDTEQDYLKLNRLMKSREIHVV